MYAPRNQRTIANPARVEGVGYWSGQEVQVEFRPAKPDSGIIFVRSDLPEYPRIPAHITARVEIPRRSCLRRGNATVEMVEHIMAALAGLQIDNCEVWVNAAEMPGCDGSAMPFVEALLAAGVVAQAAPRRACFVRQVLRLGNAESWIEARPNPAGTTVLEYHLDYGGASPIGCQSLEVVLSPQFFHINLAPSRTFLLVTEAMGLRALGMGARVTYRDLLVFDGHGPIDNQLRFPDECVRHKLLDLVGDLALAGCDLVGRFVAYRSGHRLNAEMVRAVLTAEDIQEAERLCA